MVFRRWNIFGYTCTRDPTESSSTKGIIGKKVRQSGYAISKKLLRFTNNNIVLLIEEMVQLFCRETLKSVVGKWMDKKMNNFGLGIVALRKCIFLKGHLIFQARPLLSLNAGNFKLN